MVPTAPWLSLPYQAVVSGRRGPSSAAADVGSRMIPGHGPLAPAAAEVQVNMTASSRHSLREGRGGKRVKGGAALCERQAVARPLIIYGAATDLTRGTSLHVSNRAGIGR